MRRIRAQAAGAQIGMARGGRRPGVARIIRNALVRRCFTSQEHFVLFCQGVANRHKGDCDYDTETNGELRFAQEALPSAKVAFDVGANVGLWTGLALKINPDAQYHCFEPCPSTFAELQSNDFPDSVVVNNYGLGDEECELTMYLDPVESGNNSLYSRRGVIRPPTGEVRVRLSTLDSYCADHGIELIDFVKIDVEGHELAVLKGAARMLAEGRIETIQFEYNDTWVDSRILLRDVWEQAKAFNPSYSFAKILSNGLRPEPAYTQDFETYRFSNWVIRLSGLQVQESNSYREPASSLARRAL
jgi:FkbM family methyltransferase